MSRKLTHSRSSRTQQHEKAGELTHTTNEIDDLLELPPRRKKFPSSIHKVNKWYYNLLFILFLCLVAFLFWYGNKFSV
ncbi:hypothetical protein I6N90_09255 [Paenibacillus sp. GSMTC-2017]|uniref:hypothetical protein n=1 Tax=Paenibacillus sp. GSMTC-2017 TaxID=2794350 RepID=UPI0018D76769|nr:hypothetical protein [Paenibacillus sp. GSMTC-2017]MBH5317991.1 hypothetical protein [Paenibacillus sp. GSMTC-2017]